MSTVVLLELAAGFGLVKVTAPDQFKLQSWEPFKDTEEAFKAAQDLVDGTLGKGLSKFLKKNLADKGTADKLLVLDQKVGGAIQDTLKIPCIWASATSPEMATFRAVRAKVCDLITGLTEKSLRQTSLGLAHKLDAFKLKFNPDRLDTLVVQAIAMLDDLDKELNIYAMRLKEWFGWHFPDLHKVVTDNIVYANVVLRMGNRVNAATVDFEGLLEEDIITTVRARAIVSPGGDLAADDELNVRALAEEVIATHRYRGQLAEYIRSRMMSLAPNLTVMVGEIVGARLLAAAGSLTSLAKAPASTVQILGAEKALFRALKKKSPTPKYGLLYHAAIVGKAPPKYRGRMARTVAARAALCARLDAFRESTEVRSSELGLESRTFCDARLSALEDMLASSLRKSGGAGGAAKYDRTATLAARRDAAPAAAPKALVAVEEKKEKKEKKEKDEKKSKDEKKAKDEKKEKKEKKEKRRSSDSESDAPAPKKKRSD